MDITQHPAARQVYEIATMVEALPPSTEATNISIAVGKLSQMLTGYKPFSQFERAGMLYERYCVAVGGKAFNGDPLQTWVEFSADPNKQKQVDGWLQVAGAEQI